MSDFRTLVVYFTRSGNSRAIAAEIARSLGNADVEEIRDMVDRRGLRGYWRSFIDGMRKRTTTLATPGRDVSGYDLVIIGGPVWVGAPSSPVRTWLRAHARELHSVAFFLSHGGSARDRVLAMLAAMSGRVPVAVLAVRERELGTADAALKVASFAADVRRAMSALAPAAPASEKVPAG